MNAILAEMFKHNLWANLRLLDACAALNEEQLEATLPGTYGKINDTLLHIFGAEERYAARLKGEQIARPILEEKGFQGIDSLRSAAQASGEALIEVASASQDPKLLRFTTLQGEEVEHSNSLLLVQAINHATEHRAQILTILTQQGVEPPDVSGWAWDWETKR